MPLVQRQLAKIELLAEAARSVMFFAARLLEAADRGDETSRRALRIVTPLLKFRACRDARRATGDAMEMRGGVGFIEEFADARLVRDAHLGSIWEGTSNIVAGDVIRATLREGALEALRSELDRFGVAPDWLGSYFARAGEFVQQTAVSGKAESNRQAASALYYATAARVMCWEAAGLHSSGEAALGARRLMLARALVQHKLAIRDPLAPSA